MPIYVYLIYDSNCVSRHLFMSPGGAMILYMDDMSSGFSMKNHGAVSRSNLRVSIKILGFIVSDMSS